MNTDVARVADLAYGRFCTGFLTGAREPLPQMVADEVGFAWPTKPGAGRFFATQERRLMRSTFARLAERCR